MSNDQLWIRRIDEWDLANHMARGQWGLEKESHRVTPTGDLALTAHPQVFGNKLHNRSITVDFAESQLEMVTEPFPSIREAHRRLLEIQDEAIRGIGHERLWPFSMPPRLPEEERIPIARYDDSPAGRTNEIYRKSLALRYGKKMQMISGLHYNFSFAPSLLESMYRMLGEQIGLRQFIDRAYFGFARNFMRYRWLLIYLFGASPAVDSSYHSVICDELSAIRNHCPDCCAEIDSYERHAVSLRVSRFGYSNSVQNNRAVSFNDLGAYVSGLRELMSTVCPKFEKLGMYRDGERVQLNGNILQKESEFYSCLRLKQPVQTGEDALEALERRGVAYAEVRLLDLNPYEPTGVGLQDLHFMHLFMLYCLLKHSPPISAEEHECLHHNHHQVSLFGRKAGLQLHRYDVAGKKTESVKMKDWGREIVDDIEQVGERLSRASGDPIWADAVRSTKEKLDDSSLLLAERMMRDMQANGESFIDFGMRLAESNRHRLTEQNELTT